MTKSEVKKLKSDARDSSEEQLLFHETFYGQILLLIITVLFAISVSIIFFHIQTNITENTVRQNLAKAYIYDLDYTDRTLSRSIYTFRSYRGHENNPNPNWTYPIYPEWGLYHSNGKDIINFNCELAEELYSFYHLLLAAETKRDEFNNWEIYHPKKAYPYILKDGTRTQLFVGEGIEEKTVLYNDIKNLTQTAIEKIPELKKKLLIESLRN